MQKIDDQNLVRRLDKDHEMLAGAGEAQVGSKVVGKHSPTRLADSAPANNSLALRYQLVGVTLGLLRSKVQDCPLAYVRQACIGLTRQNK